VGCGRGVAYRYGGRIVCDMAGLRESELVECVALRLP